jgi:hypothetical protein
MLLRIRRGADQEGLEELACRAWALTLVNAGQAGSEFYVGSNGLRTGTPVLATSATLRVTNVSR